jgi:hypothetical protein
VTASTVMVRRGIRLNWYVPDAHSPVADIEEALSRRTGAFLRSHLIAALTVRG